MKYKVGDKFLIEIDEVYESEMPFSSPNELFKAKGFNSLVFDKNGLDKLEKIDEDTARVETVSEILTEKYEQGLNDAWELAKKLFGYSCDTKLCCEDLKNIFGSACEMDILRNNTPQEAIIKIEAYENAKEEIKVGDVVTNGHEVMLVTGVSRNSGLLLLLGKNGEILVGQKPEHWEKTGKNIENKIKDILSEIEKE